MKRFFLLLTVPFILFACTTVQNSVVPEEIKELRAVRLDSIQSKIDENQLAEAYQDISFLKRNPEEGIPALELEDLSGVVLDRLVKAFEEQVDNHEYSAAFRYYLSLVGIGKEDLVPEWSVPLLLYRMAESSYDAGEQPLAFYYAQRAFNAGSATEPLLSLLLKLAVELQNAKVHQLALKEIERQGIEAPEDAAAATVGIPPVERKGNGIPRSGDR